MARRNVDLVISAKDEAEKVLRQITAALEEFSTASKGTSSGAEATQSSLAKLGGAIGKLQKDLGGLDVAGKLTGELRKAETELSRLDRKLEETSSEALQFERELNRTGQQAERFSSKLAGATAALQRQKGAVKDARTNQRELAAAYSQAEAAQAKFAARQAQLPALIERQSAALDKAKARYNELADRIQSAVSPSRTLQTQMDASARAVDQNAAKLNKLTTEFSEIGGQVRAAGSAMAIFGAQATKAEKSVSTQERVLQKIGVNLTALKGQSQAAGNEQNRLAQKFEQATRSLEGQQRVIDKAESNYADLAVAAGQADTALGRLSGQSLGRLAEELKAQRRAALEAKREYVELTNETSRLAASIGRVGVPTREMAESFARTKIAAGAAKTEYQQQRVALELMGRAFREAGTDISSINGVQARFQAILGQTSSSLAQSAASASRAQRELDKLYQSSTRASGGLSPLSSASNRVASANERAATATGRLAAAYREFYGDTRRSLSLLQRIRGEVLSLVAAYGGLFGVIQVLQGTVDAYGQLEAAQARLSVAVGGDTVQSAQELDFLRRTADRLGIQFGILATEYSKFAIATKNTRLEGAATREIFVSVAEAARVNRSSTEEMAGVFKALTQIVSKGTVQMEELKQQLGDRLPGALQLMADGLGLTTAEFVKMVENGEITADSLLPFARELTKRFGPGLAAALSSTSTAIGRLGNEAFEALLRFGQAGFLESFTRLAVTITDTLKTADFRAFSDNASAALAKLVDFIGFAVENFDVLVAAITAFLALRLTPVVLAIAATFRDFARDAFGSSVAIKATGTAAAGATGRLSAMTGAVGRLRIALVGLLSTTGIGLLVAAIGAGVALWATEADNATEAMVEHEDIVDRIKNTYDATGGSVEKFGEEVIKSLNITDARRNLRELQEALKESIEAFNTVEGQNGGTFATRFFGKNLGRGASSVMVAEIDKLIQRANAGEIGLEDLADEIDKVAENFSDGDTATRRYAEGLVSAATQIRDKAEAVRKAELVIKALTGTLEEQEEALRELNGTVRESAADQETAAEKAEKFAAAIVEIQEQIPKVKEELDLLEKSEALQNMLLTAIQAAQSWGDVAKAIKLAGQAQSEIDSLLGQQVAGFAQGSTGVEAAASLLREFESFRETPYYDVNAFRVGFGSDTITLADQSIKKVVQGMRVSVEDANRDLIRRITTEFAPIAERAAGSGRFATFSPQQQAALISIAYNYGEIPDRIVEAVRTGSDAQIGRAIESLGGDNGGVNRDRRRKEAALFTNGTDVEAQVAAQVKKDEAAASAAEKAAEEAQKQRDATKQRLADGAFEISQQELINQGKERQAAIEEAIRAAKADDPNITEAELQAIRDQTAAVFDLEQAKRNSTSASEKAKEAEQEVNNLLGIRRGLEDQLNLAREQGDQGQVENLRLKIGEVNAELLAAIDNAQRMWEAVGGSEAQAAITQLQTAKIETQNFGLEAANAYLQWERVGDLFVTGLASAFDNFAKKVAEGESAGKAARDAFLQFAADFLIQIAQMIIQQAIFNALQGAFGGTSFGALIGVGHTGGLVGGSRVGSGNSNRRVSPAMFASAPRYHEGGMIGLRPGEVPIIAKQGEEMLTRDDPRHMLNGGGQTSKAAPRGDTRIVNAFDATSFLEEALKTREGEEVILNFFTANRGSVRTAIGD